MNEKNQLSRRASMKSMGTFGAAALLGTHTASGAPAATSAVGGDRGARDVKKEIAGKVWSTSLVDTHEHLIEEKVRLAPKTMPMIQCNDWALLVSASTIIDALPMELIDGFRLASWSVRGASTGGLFSVGLFGDRPSGDA